LDGRSGTDRPLDERWAEALGGWEAFAGWVGVAYESAVERSRQRLVEVESPFRLVEIDCRDGLGLYAINLGGLVQEKVALRGSPCRRDGRRTVRQVKVHEDGAASVAWDPEDSDGSISSSRSWRRK
jgi:hypothetical protein